VPTYRETSELDFRLEELPRLPPFDRALLADPRDFDVEYAINPHMLDEHGELRRVDRVEARRQWETVRRTLEAAGLAVEVEGPLDGHPDFVFCANPGLPIPAAVAGAPPRWVPARMASEMRSGEVERWAERARRRGWRVEPLEGNAERFEGTGDGLWHPGRRLLWGGVGPRSSREAWEELAARYELPIVTLELADPALYHLDTCLAPLDEEGCLWAPEAFDEAGQGLVRALFPGAIEVSGAEARERLACNAFPVPRPGARPAVVIQAGAEEARAALAERGYEVLEVETGEFLKSGGSVFCMKLAYPSEA